VFLAGLSHTALHIGTLWIIPGLLLGLACAWCEKTGRRELAVAFVAAFTVVAVVTVVWRVYPQLDRQVSVRDIWMQQGGSITCLPPTNRSQRFGFDYYADRDLPDCK